MNANFKIDFGNLARQHGSTTSIHTLEFKNPEKIAKDLAKDHLQIIEDELNDWKKNSQFNKGKKVK